MKRSNLIITFIFTFVWELLISFSKVDLMLISDWIGEMAVPATLAGKNWSSILSTTSYYGWGLTWIFTPLFVLFDDPIMIFQAYRIIQYIGVALIAVIIYAIQVKWLGQDEEYTTIIIAVMISALTWIDFGKEFSLMLGIWIVFFVLLYTIYDADSKKKKIACSLILPITVCYTKNFHERATALIITVIAIVLIDYFVMKRKSVYLTLFWGGLAGSYIVFSLAKNAVINSFWSASSSSGTLYNISVFQTSSTWFLDTWENFKLFLRLLWSNYCTLIFWSYGFSIIGTVLLIKMLYKIFIAKDRIYNSRSNTCCMETMLCSFMATAIVIVGVAVNWGNGLAAGITVSGKAYNYYRYYYPFVLPGIVGVLSFIRKNLEETRKIRVWSFFLLLINLFAFVKYMFPILYNRSISKGGIVWESSYALSFGGDLDHLTNVLIWSKLLICIVLAVLFIQSKKIYFPLAAFIMIVTLGARRSDLNIYKQTDYQFTLPEVQISICQESYELIKYLEEECTEDLDIYVSGNSGMFLPYTMQFMLMDHTLVYGMPDTAIKNAIFVTNNKKEIAQLSSDYRTFILYNNEIICTNSTEYAQSIEKYMDEKY